MSLSEHAVHDALASLINPDTGRDYVSSHCVKQLKITGSDVSLTIALPYPAKSQFARIKADVVTRLSALPGIGSVTVHVEQHIVSHAAVRGAEPIPGVKNIIAVGAGKGGVGKSTTAVNLALALAAEGARVGILDADIYGPSLPTLLGIASQVPDAVDDKTILPVAAHGLQAISIGLLIDQDQPMIWRGPMVTGALMQLTHSTRWDNLDYLIVDLPPGTGDVQLTLSQKVPLTGAVIVTTPQDIAALDARKALKMFEKVGVPILGVVENMSLHRCSQCGHEEHIFGEGAAEQMQKDFGVAILGQLPLDIAIRRDADAGHPTVIAAPEGRLAETYRKMARKMAVAIGKMQEDHRAKFPKIVIKNS